MQRTDNLNITSGFQYIDNPIDIFYLIGKKVSLGALLVFPEKVLLFVDSRYIDACKTIEGVKVHLNDDGELDRFLESLPPQEVFIDGATLCFNRYKTLQKRMPLAKFTPSSKIEQIRAIKDQSEIEIMKIAGALNYKGYEHVVSILKVGISEEEAAWEYEKFCKENGGDCLSFEPIIAFGKNSAYPHHRSGSTTLENGMNVLIDCGITVNNYTSDMTRTLFFGKETNQEGYIKWKHLHDIVQQSYNLAAQKALPGGYFHTLDEEVRRYAHQQNVSQYLRHSTGHSLGQQVHEWPRISFRNKDIVIKQGMVFTIEPGLYIDGSFGVRFENTLLMTESGLIVISK
jgi:Xaa-Pro aminopeptidase